MTSRRKFITRTATTLGAITIVPAHVLFAKSEIRDTEGNIIKNASVAPSDKVNLACVGIGNQGGSDVMSLFNSGLCNIVALCGPDMGAPHTKKVLDKFPDVPRFQDFRVMFDKMAKEIDAVFVGVPDHSHFPITMLAMSLGKHVYVEKPMGRTFNEVELMTKGAKKYNVVTQMGNQGHATDGIRRVKEWVDAGITGDVKEVFAWFDGPEFGPTKYFQKPDQFPPSAEAIPDCLDWDLWLGPAANRPYNHVYAPKTWRGFYDFGNGELGLSLIHISEPTRPY